MSQNALVVPTSGTLSGLAAVQAINAAIDTLNTLSSGASAPSSPEAGQFWHDTGNKILKLRSQDNTAWIAITTLDEVNYVANAAVKAQPNIFGLTLSNDASSPASVLDIAAGGANDSTGSVYLRLTAAMKKNVTAAWASGTGNGSLDTGTFQASKFYHVHLIYNATTGAVDLATSLSYSNPSLPTGFNNFVQIGAFFSNASSDIQPFTQNGSEFIYASGFQDVNDQAVPTTPTLISLTVPGGCKVQVLMRVTCVNSTAAQPSVLIQCPDETAATPTIGNTSFILLPASAEYVAGERSVRTSTSGQVRISCNVAGPGYFIFTYGFVYPRGLQ